MLNWIFGKLGGIGWLKDWVDRFGVVSSSKVSIWYMVF